MRRALFAAAAGIATLAAAACAQPRPTPSHSEPWKACRAACTEAGAVRAAVVETDDGRACLCAGPAT